MTKTQAMKEAVRDVFMYRCGGDKDWVVGLYADNVTEVSKGMSYHKARSNLIAQRVFYTLIGMGYDAEKVYNKTEEILRHGGKLYQKINYAINILGDPR